MNLRNLTDSEARITAAYIQREMDLNNKIEFLRAKLRDREARLRAVKATVTLIGWDDGSAVERMRSLLDLRRPLKGRKR